MKKVFMNLRKAAAVILIAIGTLILLQNSGIVEGETGHVIVSVILGALGIFFISQYFPARRQWFWVALGLVLFSFALGNIVYIVPTIDEFYRQVIIFAGVGISFLTIYVHNRMQWWAMFPAGLLLSLSANQLAERFYPDLELSGILVFGLGLTFLILFAVPTPVGRLKFALLPGIILLVIGAAIIFGAPYNLGDYLLPILILLGGIAVITFTLRNRSQSSR